MSALTLCNNYRLKLLKYSEKNKLDLTKFLTYAQSNKFSNLNQAEFCLLNPPFKTKYLNRDNQTSFIVLRNEIGILEFP